MDGLHGVVSFVFDRCDAVSLGFLQKATLSSLSLISPLLHPDISFSIHQSLQPPEPYGLETKIVAGNSLKINVLQPSSKPNVGVNNKLDKPAIVKNVC